MPLAARDGLLARQIIQLSAAAPVVARSFDRATSRVKTGRIFRLVSLRFAADADFRRREGAAVMVTD